MLSVIICTCRRPESLRRTLQSLVACERPEGISWELLIVDNAPTGEVERLVGEFGAALPVRCVAEPEPGLSNARNRGVIESRGEVVWFIDDDVLVDPGWLCGVWEATTAHPEAFLFVGRIQVDWAGAKLPGWIDPRQLGELASVYLQYDLGEDVRRLQPGEVAYGANMGFRRTVFGKVGGFRSDLGVRPGMFRLGEDNEFCQRLQAAGLSGVYVGTALVHHVTSRERLVVRYALGWGYACGHARARLRAIKRQRRGAGRLAPRAYDIIRATGPLLGSLAAALTVGWVLGSRLRVRLWIWAAIQWGVITGSLMRQPDPILDWPADISQIQEGSPVSCRRGETVKDGR